MGKSIILIVALTVCVVLAIGLYSGLAYAQPKSAGAAGVAAPASGGGGSQDYMQRKGIEGLFQGRKDTTGKGPTKVQMWIGLGSVVVMIAVMKWL